MEGLSIGELEARKTGLLRSVLELSQQEALLVDLDGLEGLLEEKERLIGSLQRIDEQLAARGGSGEAVLEREREQEEQERLLAGILENERAVEERMESERRRLGVELRELERETRLRKYLEQPRGPRRKVDLKQ
jgi:transcription antitermination factor NusG